MNDKINENDIVKLAETYLNLLSRTYSAEDLAKGMIKTIDTLMMMTSHIKTTSNDNITEKLLMSFILSKDNL